MQSLLSVLSLFRSRVAAFLNSRTHVWFAVSLALFASLLILAPHELPVALYKLALVTSAAWVAYWIDRSLFPYARPDAFLCDQDAKLPLTLPQVIAFAAAMLRRALIISAAMLAVALGV